MDLQQSIQIFNTADQIVQNNVPNNAAQLFANLTRLEYDMEDDKNRLYAQRVEFVCIANQFKLKINAIFHYASIKPFLKHRWGYAENHAAQVAGRLNEACRVHYHFVDIATNVSRVPHLDIRTLSMHELYLCKNIAWCIRRSVEMNPERNSVPNNGIDLDYQDIENTIQFVLGTRWFRDARMDPFCVAYVMKRISNRVVSNSAYHAGF